jgi:hypothetical protein
MSSLLRAIVLCCAAGISMPSFAEEAPAEQMKLKDGSVLFLHPDGTGRMVDVHGKPMNMADGVEMETVDGKIIMMMSKKVWVRYGPPGKEVTTHKAE